MKSQRGLKLSNYKAIVAKVDKVTPIEGCDNIHTAYVLGEAVIVSKSVDVGHVGLLFVAGTQLSVDYCKENNLFRDSSQNKDTTKAGYFENSRRVRAQPFKKVKSEGYFAELQSVAYTGVDLSTLTVGVAFEDLNGVNVCKKYLNEEALKRMSGGANKNKQSKKKVLEAPLFKEHLETAQFRHALGKINKGDLISIQSKVHGTSVRYTNTLVVRELPKWKQLVNKVIPNFFPNSEWKCLVGTRRVVLFDENKTGFHGPEGYRFEWLEKVKPHLTKGMTVYGEIAGYANGKPIMATHNTKSLKDKKILAKYGETVVYKYGCLPDTNRFHIYRITLTTDDGVTIDFTQSQLVEWCKARDLLPSHDLVIPFVFDGDYEKLEQLVQSLTERPEVNTEDYHDASHPSEGVIIRVDNGHTTPLFLKSKSYLFRCLEGLCEEVDVEDVS